MSKYMEGKASLDTPEEVFGFLVAAFNEGNRDYTLNAICNLLYTIEYKFTTAQLFALVTIALDAGDFDSAGELMSKIIFDDSIEPNDSRVVNLLQMFPAGSGKRDLQDRLKIKALEHKSRQQ